MEAARENYAEIEGGYVSVSNFILGSGSSGVTLWGIDLSFVGGNVQESGGSARRVPQTGDEKDSQAAEGRDLDKCGSGEFNQRSGNIDTREVN